MISRGGWLIQSITTGKCQLMQLTTTNERCLRQGPKGVWMKRGKRVLLSKISVAFIMIITIVATVMIINIREKWATIPEADSRLTCCDWSLADQLPASRDLQIFDFFWKWNRPHPERRDKADKHWNVYFWHFEWFGDVSGVDSCFRIICTFKGQDFEMFFSLFFPALNSRVSLSLGRDVPAKAVGVRLRCLWEMNIEHLNILSVRDEHCCPCWLSKGLRWHFLVKLTWW